MIVRGVDMRAAFKGVKAYVPRFYGLAFKHWSIGIVIQRPLRDLSRKGGE